MERGPRPINPDKVKKSFRSWDEVLKSEGEMGAVDQDREQGKLKPREDDHQLAKLAVPKQRKLQHGVVSAEEIIRRMPATRKPKETSITPKTELI